MGQPSNDPHGITAFGSAIVRIEPDALLLNYAVSRVERRPDEAFKAAREAANRVREYLAGISIHDLGISQASLAEERVVRHSVEQFLGYRATIEFNIVVRDLTRTEEILSGVVYAGSNRIRQMTFQTSRLKEIQRQARKLAIAAAREKAETYCEAAGVRLGAVRQIKDMNPDSVRTGEDGSVVRDAPPPDYDLFRAFNPGSISVSCAVQVAFEIHKQPEHHNGNAYGAVVASGLGVGVGGT